MKTTHNSNNLNEKEGNTIKSSNVVSNKNSNKNNDTINNSTSKSENINSSSNNEKKELNNTASLKTNDNSKIPISVDKNISGARSNQRSIRTSTNFINNMRKIIDKGSVIKTDGSNKLPVTFNNRILKSSKLNEKHRNEIDANAVKLDENYHNEIGANTVKGFHNSFVYTRRSIDRISKSIHTVKQMPKQMSKNCKKIKLNIINIPNKIHTAVGKVKITSRVIRKSTKVILSNISKGNFTNTLAKGKIVRLSKNSISKLILRTRKFSKNNIPKLILGTGKLSKKATLKGINKLGKNFKNVAKVKESQTSDLGTNTVFASIDAVKNSVKFGAKGIKKIYTTRKMLVNYGKKAIKTKTVSKIAQDVKYHFSSFKSSIVTKKYIKKYIEKLKNKVREVVRYIFSSAAKNPLLLGAIAMLMVLFLVITSILNAIIGFHASYFITISPEQPQWISSMNNINSSMKARISQVSNVRTIMDSGSEPDWRDVIVAYYIKNNYSASLDGSTSLVGSGTTSVDPETWEKIYKELRSYLGQPYVWGGDNPKTGFDCSGLVQYVYGKYGISLPRITTDQVKCGTHVEYSSLQAGDLVFFGTASDVHHVGVYIGNGQYLHAPKSGDVIKISNLSARSDFYEARRVFQVKESGESGDSSTKDKILYNAIPSHKDYVDIFYKVQDKTGVDAILLASVAIIESTLNANEVSNAGASGLCQIMPDTFQGLGFDMSKIFDPYTNVLACAYEISELYNYKCIKSVSDMLTAYNGGIGNFMKYGGPIPGSRENIEYSGKVLSVYKQLSNGQQPSVMNGTQMINANSNLLQVYNCFIRFYGDGKKWVLKKYTVEEALDNLRFNSDEKKEFYNLKDYNEKFDDKDQFGDYNVDFKFGF